MNRAPWVTGEYLSFIDRREYWSDKYDSCPCYLHLLLKVTPQRHCQRLKNTLKREYIEKMLERNKTNPKKLWKMIRHFWPGKKGANDHISCLANKTNDLEKATALNNHFCEAGHKI